MVPKDVPVVGISTIHPASGFFVPVTCSVGVSSHVGKRPTAGQWHVACQIARFGGRAIGVASSLAVPSLQASHTDNHRHTLTECRCFSRRLYRRIVLARLWSGGRLYTVM